MLCVVQATFKFLGSASIAVFLGRHFSVSVHTRCAHVCATWLESLTSVCVHPVYIAGCMCLFSMHLLKV